MTCHYHFRGWANSLFLNCWCIEIKAGFCLNLFVDLTVQISFSLGATVPLSSFVFFFAFPWPLLCYQFFSDDCIISQFIGEDLLKEAAWHIVPSCWSWGLRVTGSSDWTGGIVGRLRRMTVITVYVLCSWRTLQRCCCCVHTELTGLHKRCKVLE